jgi:hypothetical protein
MQTRIKVGRYWASLFGVCYKLQKRVWYGWKTISWNYVSILGYDKEWIEYWLWWEYDNSNKKLIRKAKQLFP